MTRSTARTPGSASDVGGAGAQASAPGDVDGHVDPIAAIDRAVTELFRLSGSRRVHADRVRRSGIDLSRTEWEFLRRVDDMGALSVSELATLLDLSLPVASRALQRLQQAGLVDRRMDPSDRRRTRYFATARGRRVRMGFQAAMQEELTRVLGRWNDEDLATLADIFPRFVRELRQSR